ncbi:nuclear transport factor 2 family protein [Rufibacter quisquiliarum]|uniref:Ketosteroid isomerase-like protein n=1 Tax=Rufibacter quisquiliarum TaxID=1549639 RepID=A0A839GNA2_9BACT|nr:nuclear transport factor 2 family protein [Rufibacter quisquiliarum]MBA9075331.1 ketosteroid isomerase-like protein [Rufibacter quisquiliarum]
MKRFLSLWVICFLVFLLPAQAQSKRTQEENKVAAAVDQFKAALISGERAALEALVTDKLSYGHSSGKIEDKTTFVETLASGKSDFVTVDLTNQTIQVSGKTAIVRHQLSATTNDSGNPGTVKLGVLLVWQKQRGHWKLLARQAYKI